MSEGSPKNKDRNEAFRSRSVYGPGIALQLTREGQSPTERVEFYPRPDYHILEVEITEKGRPTKYRRSTLEEVTLLKQSADEDLPDEREILSQLSIEAALREVK